MVRVLREEDIKIDFDRLGPRGMLSGVLRGVVWACILVTTNPIYSAFADDTCEAPIGRMFSVEGQVLINTLPASRNQLICPSAVIAVGPRSRAGIRLLETDTLIRIDQNTVFEIKPSPENETLLDLVKGIVHLFSREPESLRVETPYVNSAVEGTEFIVSASPDKDEIIVIEGNVRATGKNESEGILLTDGDSAFAGPGQTPTRRQIVNPLNAVRWAFHYPSIGVKEVASESAREARSLLEVGRFDDAGGLLAKAIEQNAEDAVALALQAMLFVAQNKNDEANQLAQAAITADPESSAAYTALSYTQQAQFDIEGALASAGKAVENDPDNAYAWARQAELELSKGDLKRSIESAKKAVQADPGLSRTQSVLGFTHLVRTEIPEAISAFESAIESDQGDPLPRLGLGLANIRINKIAEGRGEIEIAVSLDPNNSLFRSYLGKAYFSEKRDPLDGQQFAIAKKLDPKDPTPWFYDAIRKQSINLPIDALDDIEKSIQLNDNRAIFRSRFLLDEDLAARGARLGLIYQDLGFEQAALAQGWESADANPLNHSAHRLLADTYSALPSHEIARDSELLQSKLLQPINTNPVQPKLAQNRLALGSGTDASISGFNDFGRLFTSNQNRLRFEGLAGSNSTWADEILISGIQGDFSYSLGQFHSETDGIRENNQFEQDLYNIFFQTRITPKSSAFIELRDSEEELGDNFLLFDPESFLPFNMQEFDSDSVRLGFRHAFRPNSVLIGTYINRDSNELFDSGDGFLFLLEDESDLLEIRHQFVGERFSITGGFGVFDGNGNEEVLIGGFPLSAGAFDTEHKNAYLYSVIQLSEDLDAHLGLSHDDFTDENLGTTETNPKIGIVWRPNNETTVRAAAFEVFRRTLVVGQTIEPTQIAGFNQFFDDLNGTKLERYGIAVDRKLLESNMYFGAEVSRREMTSPRFLVGDVIETVQVEEEDDLARLYAYWTPTSKVAISTEYQFERGFVQV